MKKLFYILSFAIFIISYNLLSQEDTTKSTRAKSEKNVSIMGRVISAMTQNPLSGVTVRILGTELGAVTKQDGTYMLRNVPSGEYSVSFSRIGYQTYIQSSVMITNAMTYQLDIELVEKTIELKGAEVRSSYFIKKVETVTSTQTLSAEDIRRAPGVQEDVIRATALLPGVGVTQAGRNDLVVRGGAPFENLFVVDNIEVSNINHFGSQGTSGGPLAIVNIDFVKNVTFSAGAFGSRFGDKVSSITNITLRNGNEEKLGGKAVLSATGFGLNLEGPIGGRGSYLFSARRSYLDLIFKAAGFAFIPEYWDFQGKANYRLDENNSFSFLTIAALDNVTLNNDTEKNRYNNGRVAIPNQKQYFSGLTWKHLFGNGFLTITLGQTYTNFNTFQNDSTLTEIFRNKSKESETILRTDVDLQLSQVIMLTFGNQLKWATDLKYDILIPGFLRTDDKGVPQTLVVDTTFQAYKNASYANLTASIGKHKITLGARLDYYNYLTTNWFISPRASVIYQINAASAISLSLGRYYQSPSYIWLMGGPNNAIKPIQADQIVLAYDHTPLEDVKVQVEAFYKWYDNYPARVYRPQAVLSPSGFDDVTNDIPYGLEPLTSIGTGFARGFEIFIQKKLSEIPLYGLFSLSISESRFKSIDEIERPGSYDARLILNLSLGYKFNEEWELSGKFRIATGLPTTPFITEGLQAGQRDFTRYNEGERLPLFHALDLRLDKRWDLSGLYLVTYLDVQNIYARKNISAYRWDPQTKSVVAQESIGVLPSIGVSLEF